MLVPRPESYFMAPTTLVVTWMQDWSGLLHCGIKCSNLLRRKGRKSKEEGKNESKSVWEMQYRLGKGKVRMNELIN